MIITIGEPGQDSLTIKDWYSNRKIENFNFSDGTSLSSTQIEYMVEVNGTTGDDVIDIDHLPYDKVVNGNGGNDTILTSTGSDTITTLDGNDTVSTLGGYNVINTGGGDDIVNAGYLNDIINTGDGDDTINGGASRTNTINAGDGNDTITTSTYTGTSNSTIYRQNVEGGKGDDHITGAKHGDTYTFNLGDGHDTIVESNYYNASYSTAYEDRIEFGEGISQSDISVAIEGDSLIMHIGKYGDSINFSNWNLSSSNIIEKFSFNDGSTVYGSSLPSFNQTVYGTNNDDLLFGNNNNNIIVGNQGNDNLNGMSGSDSYFIKHGDGNNLITEITSANNDIDIISFKDAQFDSLWMAINENDDLEITNLDTQEVTTIKNWTVGETIEEIHTNSHHTTDLQLNQLIQAMSGFSPPDSLSDLGAQGEENIRNIMNSFWNPNQD